MRLKPARESDRAKKPDRRRSKPRGELEPGRDHVVDRGQPRVLVIHPDWDDVARGDPHGGRIRALTARTAETRLAEACGLAEAIDLDVVSAFVVALRAPRPATLLGEGKVEEIAALVRALTIELVIIDARLTPVQQRNLERAWSAKVVDRTGLILEIFGARAATREGRLQVELAHLTYQKSRLVRSWTHLERQRGGTGALGGPGETQIEADRRAIAERIARVKAELSVVARRRALHRKARQRVPYPIIALVGYTNAGKSTLFNRLTSAHVFADDLLFATLDPTMRGVVLPGGVRAILSDTVGFISDLPTDLVAAFRATLEEVSVADVILHVRDISHPETEDQRRDVLQVLAQLGVEGPISGHRIVEVWNKVDSLGPEERIALRHRASRQTQDTCAVLVSALIGEGTDTLCDVLAQVLRESRQTVDLVIAPANGALLAWLYDHGTVFEREDREDGSVHVKVSLAPDDVGRLDQQLAGARA